MLAERMQRNIRRDMRRVHVCMAGDACEVARQARMHLWHLWETDMAIHSLVLDGTRHIDNNGFTRCGKLIPFGTDWQEDPAEGDPEGKLCKACYATVEPEVELQASINAEHDADAHLPEDKPLPKAAKTAKKA